MDNFDRKEHWENIYKTKKPERVGWFESVPATSLKFIKQFNLDFDSKIIDIGGGDCLLVDHLIELGYTDITVLDISVSAIERAKARLGGKSQYIKWIVSDVCHFKPEVRYDFWHDRAAFHFLTQDKDIDTYLGILQKGLKPSGILLIGTFSEDGPTQCSGIDIKQYSEKSMHDLLSTDFEKIKCISIDHETPFNTFQNFVFCSFRKS